MSQRLRSAGCWGGGGGERRRPAVEDVKAESAPDIGYLPWFG
ncbi:MAG: hypothetical protein WCA28_09805 [Bradyrhizobium sp.]